MRFFRTDNDGIYEQARATLDAAWGLPDKLGTVTCIEPAATAPRDSQGRVLLAVADEFCTFSVAVELLPQLIASGAVEEIDAETYRSSLPHGE